MYDPKQEITLTMPLSAALVVYAALGRSSFRDERRLLAHATERANEGSVYYRGLGGIARSCEGVERPVPDGATSSVRTQIVEQAVEVEPPARFHIMVTLDGRMTAPLRSGADLPAGNVFRGGDVLEFSTTTGALTFLAGFTANDPQGYVDAGRYTFSVERVPA